MSRYSFTLTLGDLTVTLSPPSEQFQRAILGQVTLDGFTPNGTSRFTGPSPQNFVRRYSWAALVEVTEEQALIIEAMRREQSPDNLPTLQDEYEYLEPEATPSKTFVAGSTITVATTRTTGFFEGKVWLEFPEEYKKNIGSNQCNPTLQQTYKELEFTLTEIPNAS